MNIYKYVNSKDIRRYLKGINYQFDSLEAAWLIYQCRNLTVREKHKAWKELIETMPDCSIGKRPNTKAQDSLHTFLQQYMELEDRYIQDFAKGNTDSDEKQYVYQFEIIYEDGSEEKPDTVFSSIDAVEISWDFDEDITAIRCTKLQIDSLYVCATALLTPDFEFINVKPEQFTDSEYDIFYGVFDGLWFDFPTPFKKGDIVWNPRYPDGRKTLWSGPLVLESLITERLGIDEWSRKNGDYTDMLYYGYFLEPGKYIYWECNNNYMDLEYYRKKLVDTEKALIPISEHLKGEIGLDDCCRQYHKTFGSVGLFEEGACNE